MYGIRPGVTPGPLLLWLLCRLHGLAHREMVALDVVHGNVARNRFVCALAKGSEHLGFSFTRELLRCRFFSHFKHLGQPDDDSACILDRGREGVDFCLHSRIGVFAKAHACGGGLQLQTL
jgi:hypothetical protein